jgi:cytochrome b pre-mRNA-processing protein 3
MARNAWLARLFTPREDARTALRPLWHAVVALARARDWYARLGVADTTPGRFDAITLVLALVLLRMEAAPALAPAAAHLTELFVEDMDGQLRESGVGDLVVGKHIGRLMSTLGGRLGAWRTALADADNDALTAALTRNMTLLPATDIAALAATVRTLAGALRTISDDALLAGTLPALTPQP